MTAAELREALIDMPDEAIITIYQTGITSGGPYYEAAIAIVEVPTEDGRVGFALIGESGR